MLLSLEMRAIIAIGILAAALVFLIVTVILLIGRSRARAKKRAAEQCRAYSEQKAVAQQVASETHAAATAETQETPAAEEEITAADAEEVAAVEEPVEEEQQPAAEEEPATEEVAAAEEQAQTVEEEEPAQQEEQQTVEEEEPAPVEEDTATVAAQETPAAEEIAQEEQAQSAAAQQTPAATQPIVAPVVKTASVVDGRPAFIGKITKNFTPELTASFEQIVLENSTSLKTRVKPVSQYDSEQAFLADFFRSSSKYAKILPIAVTEELYRRNRKNLKTDKDKVRARRKMMNAYYARRKEEDTLKKCEALCKEDVSYHLDTLGVTGVALPPLKRLVMLSLSKKRYADAIRWCDVAIAHNLIDTKGQGYELRKQKILERKARAQAAARKKKAKAAKKAKAK